jgi:hypothetical protein
MTEVNKTKTVKVDLKYRKDKYPCFGELVDELYCTNSPKLNEMFENGYLIGVEQVFN